MSRARDIVRRAAELSPSAREWLMRDERGIHEKSAEIYLAATARRAVELGLTPSQVDEQIAIQLALDACKALLAQETEK